jgi:hypothetical protein
VRLEGLGRSKNRMRVRLERMFTFAALVWSVVDAVGSCTPVMCVYQQAR